MQDMKDINKETVSYNIKQTSSVISIIAVLISMQATRIEYLSELRNIDEDRSNQLSIRAFYLSFISAFIDLATALQLLDDLLATSKKGKVNPLALVSVNELIASRFCSILSLVLLLNSSYNALEAEQRTDSSIVPNVGSTGSGV